MADSEPKRLLKPPEQYSPLSKLKFACMTGDVEAVNKLLASGTDPLAKDSRGSIYRLRTTKKCHRLSVFPGLREPLFLRIGPDWHVAPWDGQVPWDAEHTRRVAKARAALKQEKVRRWINAHSNSYVPKKRRRS